MRSTIYIFSEISIPAGKFKNESKAFVTIFNQETFANSKQNRYGSGNDVKSLKRAFQQYNHEPEVNQNFTLNEIARKMEIRKFEIVNNDRCAVITFPLSLFYQLPRQTSRTVNCTCQYSFHMATPTASCLRVTDHLTTRDS